MDRDAISAATHGDLPFADPLEGDPGLRAWVDAARARWEHPDGRDTMGFALLTLRRAG